MASVHLQLLCAYGILFALSHFIGANLVSLQGGTAYESLLLVGVLFVPLFLLSGNLKQTLWPRPAVYFLLMFFAYFGFKHYFEGESYDATKQYLFGTSGGIIFAFGIGLICSVALSVVYRMRQYYSQSALTWWIGIGYLLYVLFEISSVFQFHFGNVRSDLFLVEDNQGRYQRVGDLALIQAIVICALSTVLASANKRRFKSALPHLLIVLVITSFVGISAQLVGSNTGLVATSGFLFLYLISFFAIHFSGSNRREQRTDADLRIMSILFGGMGPRVFVGAVAALVLLVGAGYLALQVSGIDVNSLRVTGFGTGENTSYVARKEIIGEVFWLHFFSSTFSPIFGNTQVHLLTGGDYAHSLLAILTHLGLVGFAIFCTMIFLLYQELVRSKRRMQASIFTDQMYGLFRLLGLSGILVMCTVAVFFTWMPMWFALGLLGNWYGRHTPKVRSSRKSSRGKRTRAAPIQSPLPGANAS